MAYLKSNDDENAISASPLLQPEQPLISYESGTVTKSYVCNNRDDAVNSDQSRSISTNLLAQVQRCDRDAWHRFVDLFGPIIYRWCRQSGLQSADAADVLQNVLQAVHLHVDQFHRDDSGGTFRGWLWTITKNKLCDHYKHAKSIPQPRGGGERLEQAHPGAGSLADCPVDIDGTDLEASVAHRTLDLVKAQFEEQTWDAFWRATMLREKAAEIAADMGMSVAAVYKAKSRVLQRVRQELDGLLD